MSATRKYLLQATGSVAVCKITAEIYGLDDADAIERAKEVSKGIASANYYRFAVWADINAAPIGQWRVEMVPTVVGEIKAEPVGGVRPWLENRA